MANTKKEEARALDNEERDLVEKSHHPALQDLSDQDLLQLVKLTRERRDKAKTQANQRRREMRGKAAPKGATPSKSDEGSKAKLAVLAMAVRRLNSEVERRRQQGRQEQHHRRRHPELPAVPPAHAQVRPDRAGRLFLRRAVWKVVCHGSAWLRTR